MFILCGLHTLVVKRILSDNGGEFSDETYREMNDKLNVITLTTAGESPFSNRTVEHHNLVVKCLPEVALAWTISWYLDKT